MSTADSATGLGACPRAGGASEVISLIEIAVVCAGFTRVGSGPGEEAEVHAGPEAAVCRGGVDEAVRTARGEC